MHRDEEASSSALSDQIGGASALGPEDPHLGEAEVGVPRRHATRDAWLAILACLLLLAAGEGAFRRTELMKELAAESQYVTKAAQLSALSPGADVAITGDSRTLHGVNPGALEEAVRVERGESLVAYNAGLSGAPPMTQLAMIRRLLTHPHRPRLVVMSLSPYMFSTRIYRPTAREALTTIYRTSDLAAVLRAGAGAEDLATILASNALQTLRYRPRILAILLHDGRPRPPAPMGRQGFLENGESDPATQAARGKSRAIGYRTEMWRPKASFGNEHTGYFIEALRELREAQIPTIVLNSQSASQIELAYGPNSIYDEHLRWVREKTAAAGVPFIDVKGSPAITDADFVDGDHLGGNGAARFSAWLAHEYLVPALGGRKPDRPAGCRTFLDFEDPVLPGFTRSGDAMGAPITGQSRRTERPAYGYTGSHFFTTFGAARDAATGVAVSPAFTLDGSELRVRVSGGRSERVAVELIQGDAVLGTATGRNDETFRDSAWDIRNVRGQTATLRIRDDGAARSEHIAVDDVAVCP